MKSLRYLFAVFIAVSLPSCVQYYQPPQVGSGPTATIRNTGMAHDAFKSSVYEVEKIDGKTVLASAMQTPRGGGPVVTMGESSFPVPAGQPLQMELSAHDRFAADGAALAYAFGGNTTKPATRTLTFTPKPGATYVVKGRLSKEDSAVWLEDAKTGKQVP
jgi:hypothetical protein